MHEADQDINNGLNSDKVQGMATSIYGEFQRMMSIHGEDVIKELMPMVVNILEALDTALSENSELAVEFEMLKDDNEQLTTQYERERQLRRASEQQLLENEDNSESVAREIRSRADGFQISNCQLELKCKNYCDQIERLQERESELKLEYNALHERHTEMIQSYMEHIEKTKSLQHHTSFSEVEKSPKAKKEVCHTPSPLSVTSPMLQGFITEDANQNEIYSPVITSAVTSTPASDKIKINFKDEVANENLLASPVQDSNSILTVDDNKNLAENLEVGSPCSAEEEGGWVSEEVKELLNDDMGLDLDESSKQDGEPQTYDNDKFAGGIENVGFDNSEMTVNESSLFAEMSNTDIGDVDEGADIFGMSKEVDNLIQENSKLMATKHALNVVKDDLIQQVDQLTNQQTLLKEELKVSDIAKEEMFKKLKESEKELSALRLEVKNAPITSNRNSLSKQSEEEDVLPLSQRKRFTRVEMARVLMERNQYKERLMELQEAVRWTETLRASKTQSDLNQPKTKSKSSIFQFFSRLFTSNSSNEPSTSNSTHSSSPQDKRYSLGSEYGSYMSYNASTAKVIPRSKSSMLPMYGRSTGMELMQGSLSNSLKSDHGKKEMMLNFNSDGDRLQACGWSLPNSPSTMKENKENSRKVPVPVYCGPIADKFPLTKLWCAASASAFINKNTENVLNKSLEMIRGDEGGSGDASFLNSSNDAFVNGQSNTDDEIYVWVVACDGRSTSSNSGSQINILNVKEPSKCVVQFQVGTNNTNILCISSVPEGRKEEYLNTSDEEAGHYSDDIKSSTSANDEATEATEELVVSTKENTSQGVTEHVFKTANSSDNDGTSSKFGKIQKVQSPATEQSTANNASILSAESAVKSELTPTKKSKNKITSLLPTMWLGAQNGYVYVHSAVKNWSKCLHQIRLNDSVLSIVHIQGRTLAALADGTLAIFRRDTEGVWDLSNYYLLDLGRPHHSIRCLSIVFSNVWCGYRNRIHIVNPITMKIEKSFDAHPRKESQVRQLAWVGDGVWVSIRLDSTVRLYHARTLQHLQDVDVEPYVSKVLGSGKLGFSFVRITTLMASNSRLWIGTGNGVVMSVPLSEDIETIGVNTLERRLRDVIERNMAETSSEGCSRCRMRKCGGLVSCSCKDLSLSRRQEMYRCPSKARGSKITGNRFRRKLFGRRGSRVNTSKPVLSTSPRFQSERPGGVVRVYHSPLGDEDASKTFIPYCSMANAQLSFHGFREAVKFFVVLPGVKMSPNTSQNSPTKLSTPPNDNMLIMAGGEGYVDFRKGDLGIISPDNKKLKAADSSLLKSHIIMWKLAV